MEIRAGRSGEPELPCIFGENAQLVRLVAAADDFDRAASRVTELAQQFAHERSVERVAAGVRDHSDPAAALDPTHRGAKLRPLLRHEARLTGAEEPLERGFDVLDHALLGQEPGEMRASDHLRVFRKPLRAFEAARDAEFFEGRGHPARALDAAAAGLGEPGLQLSAPGVDTEPDDMQRVAAPRHRYF